MRLAGREAEREGPGLLRWWSVAVAGVVAEVVLSPHPVPKTILPDLDLLLVPDLETSLKRPKTERGRSRSAAGVTRSVSSTLSLTICRAAGVMGREGGFAAGVVVLFSVVLLVIEVVEAGCEAALERFLDEEDGSTGAEAKAGAMTRGEETEEEEP